MHWGRNNCVQFMHVHTLALRKEQCVLLSHARAHTCANTLRCSASDGDGSSGSISSCQESDQGVAFRAADGSGECGLGISLLQGQTAVDVSRKQLEKVGTRVWRHRHFLRQTCWIWIFWGTILLSKWGSSAVQGLPPCAAREFASKWFVEPPPSNSWCCRQADGTASSAFLQKQRGPLTWCTLTKSMAAKFYDYNPSGRITRSTIICLIVILTVWTMSGL